jgi:uncharacterized repeat protein (TIGR01451 family)
MGPTQILTTVTDNLPAGLSAYLPVTAPSGWNCPITNGGATVTCTTSSMIPYPTAPITISFGVTVSAPAGSAITNCATVNNPQDHNSSNNQSCATAPVTAAASGCDLMITKQMPQTLVAGQPVTFTITITNVATGSVPCQSQTPVRDPTVSGLVFVSASSSDPAWTCLISSSGVSCDTSLTLPPGYSVTFQIQAIVTGPQGSTVTNCATVDNPNDSNQTNNQACVSGMVTASTSGCVDLSTGTGGNGIADQPGTLDTRWQVTQLQSLSSFYSWLYPSAVGPYSIMPGWPYSWYGGSLSPDPFGLVGTSANWIFPYEGITGQHDQQGNVWPKALDAPPGSYTYMITFSVPNWPQAELTIHGFTADNSGTIWLDNSLTPMLTANDWSTLSGPIRMTITPGLHTLTAIVSNGNTSASATITGLLVIAEVCSPTTPSPTGCAPLYSTGLVAWWRAEGDVTDALGNHSGTWMTGSAATAGAFTAGVIGSAFDFNGANQYILVPDTPDLRVSYVTVDAWVKTPISSIAFSNWITTVVANTGDDQPAFAGGYDLFIQRDYANSNLAHAGFMVAAGGYFFGSNGHPESVVLGLNTVGLNVADGAWHHLAGTYDGQTVRIYVDGSLEGSKAYASGILYPTGSSPLYIGTQKFYLANPSPAHPPFKGQMDDIEVWNRELSPGEVSVIFHAGSTGKCLTINGNLITSVPEFTAGWLILIIGVVLPMAVIRIRKSRSTY